MAHQALISAAAAHRVRREELAQLAQEKADALYLAQQAAHVEGFPAPDQAPPDTKGS